MFGCPNHQRHPHDGIVHRPFLTVPMVGQAIAVITGEYNHRVLELPLLFQCIHQFTQLLINHRYVCQIMTTLSQTLLIGGVQVVHNRVMVNIDIMLAHDLERRRLTLQVILIYFLQGNLAICVFLQMPRHRIVRRMRAWKSDLKKEWLLNWFILYPPFCKVAHKEIRMCFLRQIPGERAKTITIIIPLTI